jgi:RNA polymerase sigma-70 factor, ECF subfamily
MSAPVHDHLREAFGSHQRFLWGLCYRMTGSAADADDLVQDTFVRAVERPPQRLDEPWRPWLVTVAINLCRDQLRRRRRAGYTGVWLPAPLETPEEELPAYEPVLAGSQTTEGRYDLMESVSYAFLLALEALTPAQRAVLLLRDVFDYSVRETADALDMGEANVKTTHHRARRAMSRYESERYVPTAESRERHRRTLETFISSLAAQDLPAIQALLSEDVVSFNDGGGVYLAALNPVYGRDKVARLFSKLAARGVPMSRLELRLLNGMPAILVEFAHQKPRVAPRFIVRGELDANGRVREIHVVLAPRKLSGVRFD